MISRTFLLNRFQAKSAMTGASWSDYSILTVHNPSQLSRFEPFILWTWCRRLEAEWSETQGFTIAYWSQAWALGEAPLNEYRLGLHWSDLVHWEKHYSILTVQNPSQLSRFEPFTLWTWCSYRADLSTADSRLTDQGLRALLSLTDHRLEHWERLHWVNIDWGFTGQTLSIERTLFNMTVLTKGS